MPNYCDFNMRVVGQEADVREFHDMLTNYDNVPHFWRVFDADIQEEELLDDGRVQVDISGDCAWSVYSCMCEGEDTYANDSPSCSTSLQKESLKKHLQIEVFSTEPGFEFAEHYIYIDGKELENSCVKYNEYFIDDEYGCEELFKDLQSRGYISEAMEFEDMIGETVAEGGFEDTSFSIPFAEVM